MKKTKAKARPNFPNTRKALRKEKRQQKKIHRQEHYMKKKNVSEQQKFTPGRFVKRPAESPEQEQTTKAKKPKLQAPFQDILIKERQKEQKEVQRLSSQMEEQRRSILLKANEDEDKVIKKLEKQLGLNKSKNKNNYFADDGLDYLLEICDRSTSEQIVAAEKHLADVKDGSDFEEDLAEVTGKDIKKKKDKQSKDSKDKRKKQGADTDSDDEDDLSDEGDDLSEESSDDEADPKLIKGKSQTSGDNNESDDDFGEFDEEMLDEGSIEDDDGSEFDENGNSDEEPEEKPVKQNSNAKLKVKETQKKDDKASKNVSQKVNKKERIISEDDLSKVFSDDEVSHLSDDDDDEMGEEFDGVEEKPEKPDVWEDIYGRKRDKEGNVIKEEKGVYVPPHLRNKESTTDKDTLQLRRQVKSVLNKLAGTNLHWACTSIEALYNCNSRYGVSSALCSIWMEAVAGPESTPDRRVADYAALVAVLHANVATEIGAHFLQELTKRFDELESASTPIEDKTLANVVSCLAHLYSFKIYHASLLYDVLSRLLELSERNIECVLVALRVVGGVLRREGAQELRTFIHDTQAKAGRDEHREGTRIKFLLEVLLAVKNNNLTKIPNYDPSYTEQLKKNIRTIIRKGNYVTPLNIRLEDLLKVEERGKWWIVGSAWEGNRPEEKREERVLPSADQELLELARRQRMNTDVRRTIFCVIMSAEDYMDAFEKLQHLGLKGQQEREIVHVLLACCLQETSFNPYYAVLARKLCDTDRRYQLSIQFSVWDKVKELENISKQSVSHLAKLLVHLIMQKSLPLSVLKIIEFSDLNKRTVKFMRQILLSIIMDDDLQSSLEVFHRISKSVKLRMFRESLRLFVQHFLLKNAGKSDVLSEKDMAMLKERVAEVNRILSMNDSKIRF